MLEKFKDLLHTVIEDSLWNYRESLLNSLDENGEVDDDWCGSYEYLDSIESIHAEEILKNINNCLAELEED